MLIPEIVAITMLIHQAVAASKVIRDDWAKKGKALLTPSLASRIVPK